MTNQTDLSDLPVRPEGNVDYVSMETGHPDHLSTVVVELTTLTVWDGVNNVMVVTPAINTMLKVPNGGEFSILFLKEEAEVLYNCLAQVLGKN